MQNNRRKLLVAALALPVAGCAGFPLRTGKVSVNEKLFDGPQDFLNRAKKLKRNMSKQEVFALIGRPGVPLTELTENMRRYTDAEIRGVFYGSTQPATFVEGEHFREHIAGHEGYELAYKATESLGYVSSLVYWSVVEKGHELALVMIFSKKEGLADSRVIGLGVINRTTKKILFDPSGLSLRALIGK